MNLAKKLSTGPVVSLVAAAGAGVAAVSDLISSLGLKPFWSDIAALAVFIILVIYWLFLAIQATKRKAIPGFVEDGDGRRAWWPFSLGFQHGLLIPCVCRYSVLPGRYAVRLQ